MSDYVKIKAIRLPIPQEILDKCDDLEEYFEQQLGDLFDTCYEVNKFTIECTTGNNYIDYILDYKYGEDCGDYGFAFNLILTPELRELYIIHIGIFSVSSSVQELI